MQGQRKRYREVEAVTNAYTFISIDSEISQKGCAEKFKSKIKTPICKCSTRRYVRGGFYNPLKNTNGLDESPYSVYSYSVYLGTEIKFKTIKRTRVTS